MTIKNTEEHDALVDLIYGLSPNTHAIADTVLEAGYLSPAAAASLRTELDELKNLVALQDQVIASARADIAAVRERCLKIAEACETTYGNASAWVYPGNRNIAAAIRDQVPDGTHPVIAGEGTRP